LEHDRFSGRPQSAIGLWAPHWAWAALAVAAALAAIPGVFTVSNVFFVRDLASSFLPHHLWFRRTVLDGQLPFWNPYQGFGFSTLIDPVYQTFFLPILPLRFLPATLGFNLIVALPVGVTALGTHLFLCRQVSRPAAALGAVAFAASGPLLSTASMPNFSWSCACIPWVLLGLDRMAERTTARRVALLALAFGALLLAGEPVTFAATVALAIAYAGLAASGSSAAPRPRAAVVLGTLAAAGSGIALAAIQIAPTAEATRRSIRAAGMLREMWSLHPARLIEAVSPFFYGKYTGMPHELTQWLFALNDSGGPLLISLYVGVPVLLLALFGATVTRRSRMTIFWCVVAAVALVAAFGSYTPVYRTAQSAIPALSLLRYPSKYVVFTALAIAILAALGWEALSRSARFSRRELAAPVGVAGVVAFASAAALLFTMLSADAATGFAQRLATALHLPGPAGAAGSLTAAVRQAAPRLLVISVLAGACLSWAASARKEARAFRSVLFALVCFDLIVANAPINPTVEFSAIAPFDWVQKTRPHPDDRVFVSRNYVEEHRSMDDAAGPPVYPADMPPVVYNAVYDTVLGNDLSSSGVRTTLAREMTGVRPIEYLRLLERFSASDRAMRYRFLSWAGTRYYLTTSAPPFTAERLVALPALGSLALYESPPGGGRVFVAPGARVEPDPKAAIDTLFDAGFDPWATALVDREPPPPAGATGVGDVARASIVKETTVSVVAEGTAPEGGGYLLLLDSYDPNWTVRVDGESAPLLRADGVFRAVRIAAGRHVAAFAYRPRALTNGAAISLLTASMLALAAARRPRFAPATSPPRSTP